MHALSTASTTPSLPLRAATQSTAPAQRIDVDSRRLFNGAAEVRIHHDGQEYRLRQTRNGKLILTK